MSQTTILLLEDEPLILMDLEMAAQDHGCHAVATSTPDAAIRALETPESSIDVAVLDVSLGSGKTCFPVAQALDNAGIPYILHSGDLDRHNEKIRQLDAQLVPKPAHSSKVIEIALGTLQALA